MTGRPTQARIDLDRLASNFRSTKAFIGAGPEVMAVVKADAYGHGAVPCAQRLEAEGVDWLAVALPEEGFELRDAAISSRILCLGSFWPGQESDLLNRRITPVVFEADRLHSLNETAKALGVKASVHIKIDTGMGRVGVRPDLAAEFASLASSLEQIEIEGLITHLSNADDLPDRTFTERQKSLFDQVCVTFESFGIRPRYRSIANSPGTVAHPATRENLVRLGGVLYGLRDDVLPKGAPAPDLKPVMSLVTKIATLKNIPMGEPLGYGKTFVTARDSRIAVIPIGYNDGLPRSLSNAGEVIVRGRRAPIVGRISMDWTIIDVTDIGDAALYDEVTLIGSAGNETITAEEVARHAHTISYEITCGIGPRVPRIYDSSK